jgi:hypothetical protein
VDWYQCVVWDGSGEERSMSDCVTEQERMVKPIGNVDELFISLTRVESATDCPALSFLH